MFEPSIDIWHKKRKHQNLRVSFSIQPPLNHLLCVRSEILEIVGLSDRRKHTPRELSGGQQQRVAIARAIVGKPQILFADEPTGNLDSRTGADIMNLLQEINRESRQTIIMVTHSPEAAKSSSRIITVSDGMIA